VKRIVQFSFIIDNGECDKKGLIMLELHLPFQNIDNIGNLNPGRSYKVEQPDFKILITSEPSDESALSKFLSLEICQVAPSLDELPMSRVSGTVCETTTDLFVTSVIEIFCRPSRSDSSGTSHSSPGCLM
jgi:hypothetical protein